MAENINNENAPSRQISAKEAEANMKELLIDLVKAWEFLYNKLHPLHYHTNAKAEAWDKISKILSLPGE